MKGHMLHVRRKMKEIMEIEENRGLINKKASKDQFTTFCQFSFGALSLLSLLSHTLIHLEYYWSTLTLEEGRKRKQRESKIM